MKRRQPVLVVWFVLVLFFQEMIQESAALLVPAARTRTTTSSRPSSPNKKTTFDSIQDSLDVHHQHHDDVQNPTKSTTPPTTASTTTRRQFVATIATAVTASVTLLPPSSFAQASSAAADETVLLHHQTTSSQVSSSSSSSTATTTTTTPLATTTTTKTTPTTLTVSTTTTTTTPPPQSSSSSPPNWNAILQKASKRALGGGKAGAAAAVVQVCTLMWLRTSMNYQYRYGGTLQTSLKTLWAEGGLPRLYQGLPFALVQGPLTRFGDTTAANVGILALLESFDTTASLPLFVKTACGSAAAGLWRIVLMPVDTSKTVMQVEGSDGLKRLWDKVLVGGAQGPSALYQGALASAAATAVGHFPWFLTYNFLNDKLPAVVVVVNGSGDDNVLLLSLARSALLGLCASCVSDCTSNSLRVIKTTKQTGSLGQEGLSGAYELSYPQVVALILEQDGVLGLFGRGLQTRLLTNMIQGAVFSVLWKYFQQVGGVA